MMRKMWGVALVFLISVLAVIQAQAGYTVNYSVNPNGAGNVEMSPAMPPGGYTTGTLVTLKAVPSPGFSFEGWYSLGANPVTTIMIGTEDVYVEAGFRLIYRYLLTVDVDPSEGDVAVSPPPGEDGKYDDVTPITLTATPKAGYKFDYWSGNYFSVNGNVATVILSSDTTIGAEFLDLRPRKLTTSISPVGSGTIQIDPPMPADGYAVETGVTLTAIANEGYKFVKWDGNVSGDEESTVTSFVVYSDRRLAAVFEAVACPVCPTDDGESTGDGASGCGCKKSDFSPEGLKKYLGDLFLAGLALVLLTAMRSRAGHQ